MHILQSKFFFLCFFFSLSSIVLMVILYTTDYLSGSLSFVFLNVFISLYLCLLVCCWPCFGNLGVFIVCVFYLNQVCRKWGIIAPLGTVCVSMCTFVCTFVCLCACVWEREGDIERTSAQHKCERHVCQYIQVISKPKVSRGEERKTKCLPQQEPLLTDKHENTHTYSEMNLKSVLTCSLHLFMSNQYWIEQSFLL